jgi:hypothetical protein
MPRGSKHLEFDDGQLCSTTPSAQRHGVESEGLDLSLGGKIPHPEQPGSPLPGVRGNDLWVFLCIVP